MLRTKRRMASQQRQRRVERVIQLDAARFDDELQQLLGTQLNEQLPQLRRQTIAFILQLLQHVYTIRMNIGTQGHTIQSVRYTALSKTQANIHLIVDTILPFILSGRWKGLYLLCVLCLRMNFLRTGRFPSLGHFLSRSHVTYVGNGNMSTGSRGMFQFIDRHLVWQGIAQLIFVVSSTFSTYRRSAAAAVRDNDERDDGGCVVCKEDVVMGYLLNPCGCAACYVCSHVGDFSSCPSCNVNVTNLKRRQYHHHQ